jgi:hypothetical protein
VVLLATTFLEFRVGADGLVKVHLPGSAAMPSTMADGGSADDMAQEAEQLPITREELDNSLAQMAAYIDDLVRTTRQEDRQTLLATLETRLNQRDVAMTQNMLGAVQTAFDELDAKHTREYATVLATLQDMQIQNATELQRMNSILAALLQPQGRPEEE